MRPAHASRLLFLRFLSESERAMPAITTMSQSTPSALGSLQRWKPVQPLSWAAYQGPVNSPCIHDAISEGAGTSSKRFAAVAAVLPSIPLTVIVLACTSIPNLDQRLNPKAYFAMADAFHVCDTAPEPTDSGQRHCNGLPNPRGPKSQQHAGSFFMPGSRASQRPGSFRLAEQHLDEKR